MDPTCITTKEEREQTANQNSEDNFMPLHTVNQVVRQSPYADVLVTYNTLMHHGSSGSPVCDAHGRVFGLHSGSFLFVRGKPEESVIEFAVPLLTIFTSFVRELRKGKHMEHLERVGKEAKGNPNLEKILEDESLTEGLNAEEPKQVSSHPTSEGV